MRSTRFDTRKLVLLALLTAIVVVLQFFGAYIRFGPFSITLVLMPITVGAALIGMHAGAWLGFVFAAVILFSGDAALFMAVNPAGTIFAILLRGALVGFTAGGVYRLISNRSKTVAAIAAAVVSPIVNTALFIATLYILFLPMVSGWAEAFGYANVTAYIFLGMIGVNFFVELGVNLLLSPSIVRLVQHGQDKRQQKKTA